MTAPAACGAEIACGSFVVGGALLEDAFLRTLAIAENAGVRALLVHAVHQRAKAFYLHYGFEQSPVDPMTLMLRLPKPEKS